MAPAVQASILARVELGADEIPVIAGSGAAEIAIAEGFLLTSHRLVVIAAGGLRIIPVGEIVGVGPERLRGAGTGRSNLVITLRDGSEVVLRVEPGAPCLGVWNVLRVVAARGAEAGRGGGS